MTRGRARGFSLVELLVVVLLLSVIASIGSLRLRRRNREFQSARLAQELYLLASRARLLALSSRGQAQLVIDPTDSDNDGQIATVHAATQIGFSPVPLAFGPALDQVAARPDARVSALVRGADLGGAAPVGPATRTAIVFAPDGSARIGGSGATGATIYMKDDLGRHPQRIVIFGRTGMAKVMAQ